MRKQDKEIKYLSQKEVSRFFKTIEKTKDENKYWLRDLVVFNLMYAWGLRASEVWLLKREHYNETTWELFIKRLKWSLNNTIRLDDKKRKLINKYLKEYSIKDSSSPLFISRNKKSFDRFTVDFLMRKYAKLAKLPEDKHNPHTWKHTIAVHIAESWVDIKDLKDYLGHKNINSSMVYFQYTTAQKEVFYNKLTLSDKIV